MDVYMPARSDVISGRPVHVHRKEKGLADVYGVTEPSKDTMIEEECLFMEFLAEMQAEEMPEEGDSEWLEVDSCGAPVPFLPTFSFDFATQLHELLPETTTSADNPPSLNRTQLHASPTASNFQLTPFSNNNSTLPLQHCCQSTLYPPPEPLQYSTESCNTRMSASQLPDSPFTPVATQLKHPIPSSTPLSFGTQTAGFENYCPVHVLSTPRCVLPSGGGYNHPASPTCESPMCAPMAPDTPPLGGLVQEMDPFDGNLLVQCPGLKREGKAVQAVKVFKTRRSKGVFNDHRSETKAERKVRLRREKNRRNQQAFRDRCRIQTNELMHLCRSKREQLSNKRAQLQHLRAARSTLVHRSASVCDDINDTASAFEAHLTPGAQRMGGAAGDELMCPPGSQRSKLSRESSFKTEPHEV